MTDRIGERPKSPTLEFVRNTAEAQLKRAGVTLSDDWSRRPRVKPATEETSPRELIRRLTGG